MGLLTADVEPLWISRYDYDAGGGLPLHLHRDYFQMLYIESGSGRATLGSRDVRFGQGHLLFLRPGLKHSLAVDPHAKVGTIDTKFRVHRQALARACRGIPPLTRVSGGPIPSLFEAMHAEARRHSRISRDYCQLLLQEIVLSLLRDEREAGAREPRMAVPPLEPSDLCSRIEIYLRGNCGQRVTQRSLSDALQYSYRHLHACWRKRHANSPLQALWQFRVEQASRRMLSTDDELKRIAEASGFASVQHFTRVFRRVMRLPPGRWRARERSGTRQDVVLRPGFVNRFIALERPPAPTSRPDKSSPLRASL